MNDCLFKPISLDELSKKLEQLDNKGNASSTTVYFQPHRLTELLGNNPSIARQLLNELLTTTDKDLAQLHESIQQQDLESIKYIAHKVKGAARIISSQQAVESCDRVEKSQDLDEAEAESISLIAILTSLSNEVAAYLDTNTLSPIQ